MRFTRRTDPPKQAAATESGSASEAGGVGTQSFEVEGVDNLQLTPAG